MSTNDLLLHFIVCNSKYMTTYIIKEKYKGLQQNGDKIHVVSAPFIHDKSLQVKALHSKLYLRQRTRRMAEKFYFSINYQVRLSYKLPL